MIVQKLFRKTEQKCHWLQTKNLTKRTKVSSAPKYKNPAQRRFLPEYMTTNYIGFRCAMSYLGESRNVTKPKKR